MYPDWPRSSADLVPLPQCDGPKLKPFDFQGPQEIDFLEYAGQGLHAHVFKVQIRGQIYALKLFRFCFDDDWLAPYPSTDEWAGDAEEREAMSAFYNYSEPFSCECRAFGRLQEAGYEELAVECFGYVLLDEEHERKLHSRFDDIKFNGNILYSFDDNADEQDNMRARFLGRDGRVPPLRGIVKAFVRPPTEEELRPADMRNMLRDVKRLQQLGIIRIDVAARQSVDGKISDFSTAITIPHFITSPELNPRLTENMRNVMELETFRLAMDDYLMFDEMMRSWNGDHAGKLGKIPLRAFPGGRGCRPVRPITRRKKATGPRIYTFVDPRLYDWKGQKRIGKKASRFRPRLSAKPPLWFWDCGENVKLAAYLSHECVKTAKLDWHYKDGLIFPLRHSHGGPTIF